MDECKPREKSEFFGSLNEMAIIQAMFPNNMFQPNIRAVHTKIILYLQNKRADTQALVDSSATENFIHHWLIKQFNIPTTPLNQELPEMSMEVLTELARSQKK